MPCTMVPRIDYAGQSAGAEAAISARSGCRALVSSASNVVNGSCREAADAAALWERWCLPAVESRGGGRWAVGTTVSKAEAFPLRLERRRG